MSHASKTVIALGGSLIVPDAIDTDFLRAFTALVRREVAGGREFIIAVGGGAVGRAYQAAYREILTEASDEQLDFVGIHATRFNGAFLQLLLADIAHPEVVTDPAVAVSAEAPVVVKAAADTPGTSSDYGAVKMAEAFSAHHLINLSNISHVYDKDPQKFSDATPLERLNWEDYLEKIPATWTPGLHSPFDPVASRAAQRAGLEVAVIAGDDLDNLENYLNQETFVGTIISPKYD